MPTTKALTISLLAFAWLVDSNLSAQGPCDSLSNLRLLIKKKETAYITETNLNKKNKLFTEYKKLSAEAINPSRRCIQTAPPPPGSARELADYYTLGKLYYQCGDCNNAKSVFNKCLANSNCGSIKLSGSKTYAQVIAGVFSKCMRPGSDASEINGYGLEYRGKGGVFVQNLFKQTQPELINEGPLTVDEIEKISLRKLSPGTQADSALARELSGNPEFIQNPPFLFLKNSENFTPVALRQEKNIDVSGTSYGDDITLKSHATFVNLIYEGLHQDYFDRFDSAGSPITVYLIGGPYTTEGLADYLKFCNTIHHRAHKRVAYYMPADNSVVAWASSGGGTIAHELVHALIANDFTEAPEWLNEGLASLYEEAENGKPKNNYRLIFIQQALENYNACIKWTDLLTSEKYQGASDVNYNLLCAYSRYFCKFIYDRYGKQQLIKLYKQLRSASGQPASEQAVTIMNLTGKTEPVLQKEWQEYFMAESVPGKWYKMTNEVNASLSRDHRFVFSTSGIKTNKAPQAADNNNSAGGEQIQQEQRELMPPMNIYQSSGQSNMQPTQSAPVQKATWKERRKQRRAERIRKRQHPEMQQ